MDRFLEQTAAYLHRAYGTELDRFCMVFPNVRAGLFFRKYLAQLYGKPAWAPAFRPLHSLFEEITGLTQADSLTLVMELYRVFKKHREKTESFDEFYFWGEMLLDDFDDVDKNRVKAHDLFCNVSDLKNIDLLFDYLSEGQKEAIRTFWQGFNGGKGGALKTDFSAVWPLLYPVYTEFRERLKAMGMGYEGMIQREAVRCLREGSAGYAFCERYAFVGFNALTRCESFFFKVLQKSGRAVFFWDYDDAYVENAWHEAGMFMRDNIRRFPSELHLHTKNLKRASGRVEVISVPSVTGQARLAGEILEELLRPHAANGTQDGETARVRTAVVLPDEYMLLPVLSALPEAAGDVNITMGYPFTCSPAYSLFERLAALQQHCRVHDAVVQFHHRDVCMVLDHPYVRDVSAGECGRIVRDIAAHNRIYVQAEHITEDALLRLLFTPCTDASGFADYLMAIVSRIAAHSMSSEQDDVHEQTQSLHLEYLYTFFTSLQRFRDVLAGGDIPMDVPMCCRLLRKSFASVKIPFSGEPLRGVQVMGVLETRALDFDRVIILSMNEGTFPRMRQRQSYIPYNLRLGFGLTTSEHRDAVSAYHFYRLIQRADDVRLIYNSAATDSGTCERSRFISQLIYEPGYSVKQRNIVFSVSAPRSIPIVKTRTEGVMRKLGLYLTQTGDKIRSLSPSAINSYMDCRLQFYFRYIDGLKEIDEVTDEVDPSVFGKLLHKTMELVYRPYIGTEITAGIIVSLQTGKQHITDALYRAFAEDYFHVERITDADITGRNIIIREVLLKYVTRILEVDRMYAPFTLLSLEEHLNVCIPVCSGDNDNHALLNLHGCIDRIDCTGNTLRIIDYKTGNVRSTFAGVSELFHPGAAGNPAVLQALTYACMMRTAHGTKYPRISPGLYMMKDLFADSFDPRIRISKKVPIDSYMDVADEFEACLGQLLSEMFLSDVPFTQTDNHAKCKYCPYADICHRN